MMLVQITEPPKERRTWDIDIEARYDEVMEAVCGEAPAPECIGKRHLTELDMWLDGPTVYELMWFTVGSEFAEREEDEQRLIMAFAAECLYGPEFDLSMLLEAVLWANEDDGL